MPPRREDRRAWGWGPDSSAGRPATPCPAIPYPGTSGVRSSPRERQAGSLKAVAVSRSQGISPPARCGRAEGGSSLLSQRLGAAGVRGLSLCLCLLSLAPLSLRGHSSLDLGLPGESESFYLEILVARHQQRPSTHAELHSRFPGGSAFFLRGGGGGHHSTQTLSVSICSSNVGAIVVLRSQGLTRSLGCRL